MSGGIAQYKELDFLAACEYIAKRTLQYAREQFLGSKVLLEKGKYKGRIGEVAEVTFDDERGLRFLVHPYREDGTGFLTDHPDARSCWSSEELRFEGSMMADVPNYTDEFDPTITECLCERIVADIDKK